MTKRPRMRRDAVSPFRDKLWDLFTEHAKGMDGADVVTALKQAGEGSMENPDTPFLMLAKLTAMSIVFGSLSFITLVAAGLATVLLMFRSRVATLRQINANLLQISEQLKRGNLAGEEPKKNP